MKYNTLISSITLAILLAGFPSLEAGSDDSTKQIAAPKIETLLSNLENIEPLSSKSENLSSKLEDLASNLENIEPLSSKLEDLASSLNSKFHMDEIPKGWQLVDSSKNKNVSLKQIPKGVAILGDQYSFYTNVPNLKNFDKITFLFSAELRSSKPGAHIQYYDGKNTINSARYTRKKGEWQTLTVEFTVDPNARFHRLYAAILGSVKGNDKPSVEIRNIKLQPKKLSEKIPTRKKQPSFKQ